MVKKILFLMILSINQILFSEGEEKAVDLTWKNYGSSLVLAFTLPTSGGVSKFMSDISTAKITLNSIADFSWHFNVEKILLAEKINFNKKLSVSSLLSLMAEDLVLLTKEEYLSLSKSLLNLKSKLNIQQPVDDSSESNNAFDLIKACRENSLIHQKSFLFLLDRTSNLLDFVLAKTELIKYFLINSSLNSKKNSNESINNNSGENFKDFIIKQKLIQILWRLQSFSSLAINYQEDGEDFIFEKLSTKSLDLHIGNINTGIFSLIPDASKISLPSQSVVISSQEFMAQNFMAKALWSGLELVKNSKSSDPRFFEKEVIYPKELILKIQKRVSLEKNKSELKNLSAFEENIKKINSLLGRYKLEEPLPKIIIPDQVVQEKNKETTADLDSVSERESKIATIVPEKIIIPEADVTASEMGDFFTNQ